MARYQLLIEYVGTNFRGWQIQKKGLTIQGIIQKKITKLIKEKITLNGSGRTDTGVHAIEQSAHFDCKNEILDLIKVGGLYIIDDMLAQPNWPDGHQENVDKLIEYLEKRKDFNLTKMNWSTGIIIATKKY